MILLFCLQLQREEAARNEAETKLSVAIEETEETKKKHELDVQERDNEIRGLKEEVKLPPIYHTQLTPPPICTAYQTAYSSSWCRYWSPTPTPWPWWCPTSSSTTPWSWWCPTTSATTTPWTRRSCPTPSTTTTR